MGSSMILPPGSDLAMSELKLVLSEKFDAEAIRAKPNTSRIGRVI